MNQIQQLKELLETAAFLVSKGGAEREVHKKILESIVLLSQIEQEDKKLNSDPTIIKTNDDSIFNSYSSNYKSIESIEKAEIKKLHRRLPRWFNNRLQINSKILYCFLELHEENQEISVNELRDGCRSLDDFYGNYNQMKNFGEKNHGKVFEERNGYVTLWQPIKDDVLRLYNQNKP